MTSPEAPQPTPDAPDLCRYCGSDTSLCGEVLCRELQRCTSCRAPLEAPERCSHCGAHQ